MLSTVAGTGEIAIQKINYEQWKTFDTSVKLSTNDVFTLDLSDRFGDVFIDVDWEKEEEVISPNPILDGVFVDSELVGLIDYHGTIMNGKEGTVISFMLIHPNHQRRGIGKELVKKVIETSETSHVLMYPCTHASKVLCTKLGFTHDKEYCQNWDYRVYVKQA
jgi:GNAT superfamily N-acetyltransferase